MEWDKERAADAAFKCIDAYKRAEIDFMSNFIRAYLLEHPEDREPVLRFLDAYTTAKEFRAGMRSLNDGVDPRQGELAVKAEGGHRTVHTLPKDCDTSPLPGHHDERDLIVQWLRRKPDVHLNRAADAIERGAHRDGSGCD